MNKADFASAVFFENIWGALWIFFKVFKALVYKREMKSKYSWVLVEILNDLIWNEKFLKYLDFLTKI